jgi:hypothetical protein
MVVLNSDELRPHPRSGNTPRLALPTLPELSEHSEQERAESRASRQRMRLQH